MTPPTLRQQFTALARDPLFREGLRDYAPVCLGIAVWGTVAGVAMTKAGLDTGLAILMSLLVFAGSAQLATVPLIVGGASIWVVWATTLCINLRFVVFSAQWRPYLAGVPLRQRILMSFFSGDTMFVLFMRRFPEPQPGPGQIAYFSGAAVINWLTWQSFSILGIVLGEAVPTRWGFAFAGTMALTALTCALLKDRSTWIAAAVAAAAAVWTYTLPLKLNIMVAITAAVATGVVLHRAAALRGMR
ncbi:MAG TPA: AzlC family ABC transporter permease [Ramlibacter sp.]|nr:AzlC family ABC transporter permease [Ramlibacter sp.]